MYTYKQQTKRSKQMYSSAVVIKFVNEIWSQQTALYYDHFIFPMHRATQATACLRLQKGFRRSSVPTIPVLRSKFNSILNYQQQKFKFQLVAMKYLHVLQLNQDKNKIVHHVKLFIKQT